MHLDILAFGAHPDDIELSCAGTILSHISSGKKIGIVDLTKGDLGTRGTPQLRIKEAKNAAKILGVSVRENLGFADGFFENDKEHRLEVIKMIRKYKPKIIFANAIADRHPDHARAAKLVWESCFLSGLIRIETIVNGKKLKAWRPKAVYHYIQDRYIQPNLVVDISLYMEKKMEAIKSFQSQFYDPHSKEPLTYISGEKFLDGIYSRAQSLGKLIDVKYAEGFTSDRVVGIENFSVLL